LRSDDYVFSTHRGHGHAIAKGLDLKELMAELNGKGAGTCKGFGGSMHIYKPDIGFMGTTGVVGGNLPLALGTAYASTVSGDNRVTVCFFGDGASAQGSSHESFNMSTVLKLPVIYVCENNLYAATTHVSVNCPTENIADRALGYGLAGEVVDGNDVLAVRRAAAKAAERARAGEGPTLLECKTYRHKAHCMIIPEHRKLKERRAWGEKDPVVMFRLELLNNGKASETEIEQVESEEEVFLEEAVRFMNGSASPDPKTVGDYLWV
jgi:TPP-dependent pyruvate/acetoin dehydrogenase alpha subunit